MKFKPFIIPLFIPHIGCPHRCVFCNQTSITGHKGGAPSPEEVRNAISRFLGIKHRRRHPVEVAFYGGTFLGLSRSYRDSLLDAVQGFVEEGEVDSIRFSTRPDTISDDSLMELSPYAVRVIEVGAQSTNESVLALSRRGHTAEDTRKAVNILKSHKFRVGIQIMPGLPGDTPESILETGREVAKLKPDFVRIYPTVVVKNTVLERWFREGRFKPLSLSSAIELTKTLYLLFKAHNISVIRMGLQASDGLLEPGNVVGGPFHPAFGHLVHSALFFDRATQVFEDEKLLLNKVVLKVHPRDVSRMKGIKNHNIEQLMKRFDLKELRVIPDPEVSQDMLKVDIANLPLRQDLLAKKRFNDRLKESLFGQRRVRKMNI
ncbi:MAG: radical SAM protein [Deltaproteobacteria bacterium]|nr:radical SAM protein [Deltaproteobacteria bacterium]